MAKQEKKDRKAVIDSIRKDQARSDKRRGLAIVAACGAVAIAIVAAAAYKPISDRMALSKYDDADLSSIGAGAEVCGEITTKKATGNQDHVEVGTPLSYPEAPPAFGKHWNMWDGMERKLYTASDRPELGELVHNLEHGYTLVWYDETAADDDEMMADLRGLASKFEGTSDLRDKFKAVPWTSEDGGPFLDGKHIAYTHWSVGGVGPDATDKPVGAWQYCSEPSGAALQDFMVKYPYMDSPEPTVV